MGDEECSKTMKKVETVMEKLSFKCGDEHRAKYPFLRTTYELPPETPDEFWSEPIVVPTWRPGVEHESDGQYDFVAVADAEGEVVYTVIGTFKPGSFPARIFYTRHWIDPTGKRFGKNKLYVTTQQNFRNLVKGYRYEYELQDSQ